MTTTTETAVLNAVVILGGDCSLADIRTAVLAERSEVDAALKSLQAAGQITLRRQDDNGALTDADRAAELKIAGFPRHLVRLG